MEGTSVPLSSLPEAIFGKPIEKISCNDIRIQVEIKALESLWLEFKAPTRHTSKNELIAMVLKSVTGFLNSDVGEGILILGIKGKERAEELVCIPRELLGRNRDEAESRLRNWIFSYMGSIPPAITPPRLVIRVFDCKECGLENSDGWIAVIYVKRTFDALYYSKVDDIAYQRRGSETKRLSLEEVQYIIDAKRQPIVIVLMKPVKIEKNRVTLKVIMHNKGSRPANNIVSVLFISKRAFLGRFQRQGKSFTLLNPLEVILETTSFKGVTKREEDREKIVFQVNVMSPHRLPVFPMVNMEMGEIDFSFKGELSGDTCLMIEFVTNTFTELNQSIQKCFLVLNQYAEFSQICTSVIVKDYMGKAIFEARQEKGGSLVYDERGARVV